MDSLIDIIEKIYNQKLKKGKIPFHVQKKEIFKEITMQAEIELQNLVDTGRIFTGDTINDKYYSLFKQKTQKELEQKPIPKQKSLFDI